MFQNGPRGPAPPPRPAPRPAPPQIAIGRYIQAPPPHAAPAPAARYVAPARPSFASAVGRTISHAAAPVQRAVSHAAKPAPAQSGDLFKGSQRAELAKRIATMRGLEQSVFASMGRAGVLAPGAKMPQLVVDRADPGWLSSAGRGALAEYVTPGSGPGGRVVHIPPSVAANEKARPWVSQALVHEIAHTMQNNDALNTDESLREGGAQAYTERVVGRVLPGQPHYGSGGYTDYVNQINAREPHDWVTQGQFQPGRQAPAVNMPGTPSFRVAMNGVGRRAGAAVRFAGRQPEAIAHESVWDPSLRRNVPLVQWLAKRRQQ